MTLAEQLAEVWPNDLDLSEEDVNTVEDLSSAIARLCESLGAVRAGFLLVSLGKRIGLS